MWGATLIVSNSPHHAFKFQSTHPCGVRLNLFLFILCSFVFQSTHPCGVRQGASTHTGVGDYFNPRTHVGCDETRSKLSCTLLISIHAPMWGATDQRATRLSVGLISIHAPMWGATQTPHLVDSSNIISIHAPMWGATKGVSMNKLSDVISIHAPMWGATLQLRKIFISVIFQSTHPCGVRRK